MKHILFILLIIILVSCGSRKQVIAGTPKDTNEVPKVKDSIIEDVKVENETETISISEEDKIEDEAIEPQIEHETTLVYPKAFNHAPWNDLLKKYVSKNGNVNYKGLKNSRGMLLSYITTLSNNLPTNTWTKEDKLAYWINAYNAMTVDLILRHYPLKSIKNIKNPWEQRYWKLGVKWYNLNEIEHQILRKMDEPRIHFAIVCASFSCPKLQNEAFIASNINEQLTQVTKMFLADEERNNISQSSLNLSKIFQWFSKDFKEDGSLIDFLNKYSEVKISNKAKKSFKDYNWDLNE